LSRQSTKLGIANIVANDVANKNSLARHTELLKVWPPVPSLAPLSAWEANNGRLIRGTTIAEMMVRSAAAGYTYKEVRFMCKRGADSATLDVKASSPDVLSFMTGGTNTYPDACSTSQTLAGDTGSVIGQSCKDWGAHINGDTGKRELATGKWGIHISTTPGYQNPDPDHRLYQFPLWIYGQGPAGSDTQALIQSRKQRGAHFAIDGATNRFECDNFPPLGVSGEGDTWNIFIR